MAYTAERLEELTLRAWRILPGIIERNRVGDSASVSAQVRLYLRDCYDHAVQIAELTETFRELCGNLLDLYPFGGQHAHQ